MDAYNTIDINNYTVIKKIGEGGFGQVLKVKDNQSCEFYAAKVSLKTLDKELLLDLSREVNILSKIQHPFIVKFVGFSSKNFQGEANPVIITEYLPNGSLHDIILNERRGLSELKWNDTRKLINIYGIAHSMLYLHQNKIIHRDLKPGNILMDEFLCPKICDFGLSKIENLTAILNSSFNIKGTPAYISPEIWKHGKYSTASDVYAFGFIVYEIISNNEPYKNLQLCQILDRVVNGRRPIIDKFVPDHYRKLIERCWSQKWKDRPSFEEIVDLLRNDESFTDDLLDKEDFYDYVSYIDSIKTNFDPNKRVIRIDEFLNRKSNTFEKIHLKNNDDLKESSIKRKRIYPRLEYMNLNKDCQRQVDEAEKDPDKMFDVGFCLLEGKQGFPVQREIGIRFLEEAINNGSVDAAVYYGRILIKGEVVPQDLDKAEEIMNMFSIRRSSEIALLLGLIMKKKGKHKKAFELFGIASSSGNGEAQYERGKLLYKGNGCNINKPEAMKMFKMSKKNGINKCDKFLSEHEKSNLPKLGRPNSVRKNVEKNANPINDMDSESLFKAGCKYYNGEGVPVDKKEAARYYRMAANKGHIGAMNSYAFMLKDGDEIQVDKKEAVRYFKMAIDKGDSDAMYNYALILDEGDEIQVDKKEAARLYKMAANKGHVNSMYNYALMLKDGDGILVNKKEAINYFKMGIEKGHINSMYSYATILDKGDGIPVNKKEAAHYYKMAANKGDRTAMYNYAFMLNNGDGIPIDKKEAAHYFKMAAEKGDGDAMYNYAHMLNNGDGIPTNKKEAVHYYKMAAKKGHSIALYNYAHMLDKGDGIQVDKKKAAHYYKISVEKGVSDAMYDYAVMLKNGDGIPVNKKEAVQYYKMAIEKGVSDAMYDYALMLKHGDGISVNKKEAAHYFMMGIEKGHIDSMYNYAMMLDDGDGIQVDKKKASHYYKMAANKGHITSMYDYAVMLKEGDGIPTDKKEAARYYKMAAEKGDSDAMYDYAMMLDDGDGIPVDKKEAARYYKMAADKGNSNAMYSYAIMLNNGDGIQVDKKKAARYFKMAINKGHTNSMYNYAMMLDDGDGVPVDKKEAARYFKMAANKGEKISMYNYALMLKNGDGIPVDKEEAARYFKMAAEKGDSDAMYNYALMLNNGDGIPVDKEKAATYLKMASQK